MALGRAVQLARITNGLYTPRQLPILRKRVENAANRGDWKAALEQMEHLLWLYQTKSPAIDGVLVDALMQLSKLHIRGVAKDTEAMQTSHFRQSAYINRLALRVAQTAWGEHDRRLSPLLYNLLKQYHLQAVAIGRGGRAGFELRSIHPDSGVLRERPEVLQSYYLTGLGILNQIMELYSRGEVPQLEGLAMSNFYLADWQVLFTHKEEALATYSIAYNYLVEAEVDPGLINRYFNQPEVLPVTEFYASIEAGLQGRLDQSLLSANGESAKGSEYLLFNEWTAGFPDVSTPMGLTPTPDSESNFALFSYSLAGLSEVTRWHQGRFTAGISMVQMAELIDLFPPSSFLRQ